MSERMQATIAGFTFLINNEDQVYLQRRYQTNYLDGHYEPPTGKVDLDEFPQAAACREASEEAGVEVVPGELELFHTYMNLSGNDPWLGLMFRTRFWRGKPAIQEPDKCDDAGFFDLERLPRLTPQVKDGISRLLIAPAIEMANYSDIPAK